MVKYLVCLCVLAIGSVSFAAGANGDKSHPAAALGKMTPAAEVEPASNPVNEQMAPAIKLQTVDGYWECVNGKWVFCPRKPQQPEQSPPTEPAPKFDLGPAPGVGVNGVLAAVAIGIAAVVGAAGGVAVEWKRTHPG